MKSFRSSSPGFLLLAAVASMSLLLAACGGAASGGSGNSPVKVAFVYPESGAFSANGADERAGWQLGLKDAGSTVDGHKIQTLYADGAADPNTALSAARQLINNQGAQMLVGPVAANVGLALRDAVAGQSIPTVYFSACPDEFATSEKTPNLLLTGWTCDQPSLPFGKYVYQTLGYHHITTIGLDFAFGWQVIGGFLESYEAAGGKVDKEIWNPVTTADFSSYVTQIPSGTQAVFALESGNTAVKFLQAYRSFGLKDKLPLLGGGTLTDYSSLRSDTPADVEGVITPLMYADGLNTAANNKFVNEYHKATGTYPSYYAESGYSGALQIVAALKKVHGNAKDAKALMSALKSAKITGARGPVSINSSTNSPVQNIYVRKVEMVNGALRNVPIHTFKNVEPWYGMSKTKWEQTAAHYTRSSF